MISIPAHLATVASTIHKLSILLFGYFIPALSSVKAVVRKDAGAFHQWSTYWLILHLYITILSPLLHLTLHPIFQIFAILWLSLPQYQGASVAYERIVTPWVDQYESKVDDAVDEAHRGMRRWLFSRFGSLFWLVIGEGGSLAEGIFKLFMSIAMPVQSGDDEKPSNRDENSSLLQPRHSLIEALRQNSSFEEVENYSEYMDNHSFEPTDEFIRDFLGMLQQGLYVFANVDKVVGEASIVHTDQRCRHVFEGGFKLGVLSYSSEGVGALLISPAAAGENDNIDNMEVSGPIRLPLDTLQRPLETTGTQGLILSSDTIGSEIVLSDQADRNILLNGLNACLPSLVKNI